MFERVGSSIKRHFLSQFKGVNGGFTCYLNGHETHFVYPTVPGIIGFDPLRHGPFRVQYF